MYVVVRRYVGVFMKDILTEFNVFDLHANDVFVYDFVNKMK